MKGSKEDFKQNDNYLVTEKRVNCCFFRVKRSFFLETGVVSSYETGKLKGNIEWETLLQLERPISL